MKTEKCEPVMPKQWMCLVAAIVAGVVLWMPRAAEATVIGASWNSNVNLDKTAGGSSSPTTIGSAVAITTGSSGKFGEGINLPLGTTTTGMLSYDATGFNKTQGTVSFWYQPGQDSATYTSGRILTIETAAGGGGRLVDVYRTAFGFDAYMSANSGTSQPGLSFSDTDWLYFAFEWDSSTGAYKLWVGKNSGSASSGFTPTYAPWTPTAGAPVSINIGSFDGTVGQDQFSRGTWDDLYITDQLPFDPAASSILMPLGPLTVPEPSVALLWLAGAGALWLRRRR